MEKGLHILILIIGLLCFGWVDQGGEFAHEGSHTRWHRTPVAHETTQFEQCRPRNDRVSVGTVPAEDETGNDPVGCVGFALLETRPDVNLLGVLALEGEVEAFSRGRGKSDIFPRRTHWSGDAIVRLEMRKGLENVGHHALLQASSLGLARLRTHRELLCDQCFPPLSLIADSDVRCRSNF